MNLLKLTSRIEWPRLFFEQLNQKFKQKTKFTKQKETKQSYSLQKSGISNRFLKKFL